MGRSAVSVLSGLAHVAILLSCVVVASADPEGAGYGKKVAYRPGQAIRFQDFELTFHRQVCVPWVGHPRGLVYYDFEAVSGDERVGVTWSEGTGEIAAKPFTMAKKGFLLELKLSESVGWLKEGELVVRRANPPGLAAVRGAESGTGFRFVILRRSWNSLNLGYAHEPAWAKLRAAPASPLQP